MKIYSFICKIHCLSLCNSLGRQGRYDGKYEYKLGEKYSLIFLFLYNNPTVKHYLWNY